MNRKENTILKSDTIDQAFDKIKLAFDQDQISSSDYIQCYQLHKRTIEIENSIMKSKTVNDDLQKSDSLDQQLNNIKTNIMKAFDGFERKAKTDILKAGNAERLKASPIIHKSRVSETNVPFLKNLVKVARNTSERDLRKLTIEGKFENIRIAANLELLRRGKIA